jgi:hypothetical protein
MYYRSLKEKYERAARYPWLPIEPDQHEPEWPAGLMPIDGAKKPGTDFRREDQAHARATTDAHPERLGYPEELRLV